MRSRSKLVNLKISAKVLRMRFWSKFENDSNFLILLHSSRKHFSMIVFIRICSSWLTFTALQWMKTNFKISEFSRLLLRSEYAIQFKIWKWAKLANSVIFIKKTLVNQVYILIRSFWLYFTVLQWMKTNFNISQFLRFLLSSDNDLNFLILLDSSRKHL